MARTKYTKGSYSFAVNLTTLQMFTGVFPAISMKRAVRITEKPYTPQRERLCMLWGNPVIFTDCREISYSYVGKNYGYPVNICSAVPNQILKCY